jgi:hypothetical protein
MAPSRESSRRLHDKPVSPLQLVMHIMYNEEEVPNTKHMRVVEEELLLSQPKIAMIPMEEEEVPVLQGPAVVVPLEEEEVPAPLSWSHRRAPLSQSYRRKKSRRPPLYHCPSRGRGGPNPPCHGPAEGKGMPCPCTALGKFFALLFSPKNIGDSYRPFFS